MDSKIKLLIADSNTRWTKAIQEYLIDNQEIEFVGAYADGSSAWNAITESNPNVIIINMILPVIDGLGIIENIKNNLPYKPGTICVSSVQNEFMIKQAFSRGVAYFASLPIEIPVLMQRVLDIGRGSSSKNINFNGKIAVSSTQACIDEKITAILLAIGIPANIKGYPYLREAVTLAIEDTEIVNKITKELYPQIARKFDTSASKVERAVRHAIDVAWNRGRIKNMNEIFGIEIYSANDRPTNGEFIALVADRISIMTTNAQNK